jgi:tetratricopeptide (TPR) repeat protein
MKSKLLLGAGGLLVIGVIFIAASAQPKSDPAEAARLNNLGCAYMNQQFFEKALKYFEDAAAADPNLSVAKLNQGVALMGLARVGAAKKILDQAAKENPKDPHVWYSLGMLDKNSSDPQAAVEDFKHVIEIDDRDADTWYFLGTVYAQLKQFPQAIDAFEHALKLNPLHASAQFGLSRALQQSGDTAKAREHLTRFQYITQNHLGAAMSLAYGDQGKYSLAEESPAFTLNVPPQIPVKFVDVSKEAGIAGPPALYRTEDSLSVFGPGACFLDYAGTGKIDIFLSDHGPHGGLALLNNLGNGRFEDITERAGLNPKLHAIGCTAGDYDNDGATDIAVTVWGGRIMLLHNEKNGTFKDMAESAGIKAGGPVLGVTFVDYDHDGDLDLLVTHIASRYLGQGSTESESFPEAWRNNGNGTFTNVSADLGLDDLVGPARRRIDAAALVGTDYNNDRAVDLVTAGLPQLLLENPREGKFKAREAIWDAPMLPESFGVAVLDFDHDGWMDQAFTTVSANPVSLWRNDRSRAFELIKLPETSWTHANGIAAFDYDNDGWVDLVAVGETKEGKGEIKLFRNLGPNGWKDVTSDVGLDKIQLKDPRAIITGDYDNDGATDLLITQNHGPAVLLKNEGGNKNHWLRLALKGLNDNKSAIGTKVDVFSDGIRQKYEIYGSNGYLGQNSPYLTIGLGPAKQADVVRMLWPTGVLQDEVEIPANHEKNILEIDRRGSSCPTLFVWDGKRYVLVSDMLGAGVVGHWVGPGERNIPRPTEWVKIDSNVMPERQSLNFHMVSTNDGETRMVDSGRFSFFLMEPMEEVVYLDAVKLMAVDHPANEEVYPNEYFASNPPYPEFKVITSRAPRSPARAWDDKGNNLLPDLRAHKYVGNLDLLPFKGFTKPHRLTLDLGEPYRGGPLRLLMHGEIEYFTANSMYAAWQAGINPIAPYVEAEVSDRGLSHKDVRTTPASGDKQIRAPQSEKWVRVRDDMGFPAGLPKTITVDLSGKFPLGSQRMRISTNLEIYWDNIQIDRTEQHKNYKLTAIPLTKATLENHGYPLQIEDQPPGNVKYVFAQVSRTGPYARQAGEYTRYGDVLPLLTGFDDKLVVFGSGEGVALEFDPANLPSLPQGWVRDYFFMANGYEKDMDFYAFHGGNVEPLPFKHMGSYPYPGKSFPLDSEHLNYMLEYNTRFVSGKEPSSYSYSFGASANSR